ncbi:hypothetical protein [Streptomyces rapamycinicus]|uniref:hypothetical protein n=1 Tax=Streptomyces rapamycinicus TaxID=1226757 RepID=UPI0032D8F5B6
MHGRADSDGQHKSGRIELSVAHVAGSALAAVAAAVLASKLGVYGTILGAGVVSVVATAGGTVFQHLFRRTGEQIKEVRVQTRPTGRRWYAGPAESAEPGAPRRPGPRRVRRADHARRPAARPAAPCRRAAAVFIAAMSVITGIEMFSGGPVSNVWGENRTGTTVSDSVSGSPGPKSTPAPRAGTRPPRRTARLLPGRRRDAVPAPPRGGAGRLDRADARRVRIIRFVRLRQGLRRRLEPGRRHRRRDRARHLRARRPGPLPDPVRRCHGGRNGCFRRGHAHARRHRRAVTRQSPGAP